MRLSSARGGNEWGLALPPAFTQLTVPPPDSCQRLLLASSSADETGSRPDGAGEAAGVADRTGAAAGRRQWRPRAWEQRAGTGVGAAVRTQDAVAAGRESIIKGWA